MCILDFIYKNNEKQLQFPMRKNLFLIYVMVQLFCCQISHAQRNQEAELLKKAESKKSTEYSKALGMYTQILNISILNTEAYKGRAECFENLGQIDNAIRDLEVVYKTSSTDGNLNLNLGRLYGKNGQIDRAIEVLNKNTTIPKSPEESWFYLWYYKILDGQAEKVLAEMEDKKETLKYGKGSIVMYLEGMALDSLNRKDSADIKYSSACMILPTSIKEYNKMYGKLIELVPYQLHYKNRADRLFKENDYSQYTIEYYYKVLNFDSLNHEVIYNLAVCHYNNKNYPEAKKYFDKSLKFYSNRSELYYYLGHLEFIKGNWDVALINYKNGIELRYENARIYYEAGTCAKMKANYTESKLYYKRAIEKFEDSDLTNSEREDIVTNLKSVNAYIIERNRENVIPQITIKQPFSTKKGIISWNKGAGRRVEFVINDQSPIQRVFVNDSSLVVDSTINDPVLTYDFKLTDTEAIFVFADIYGNVNEKLFNLQTTDSVKIEIQNPPQNMNNEFVPESPFSTTIIVSGKILTDVPQVEIRVNGTKSYLDSLIINPEFTVEIPYSPLLDSVRIEVIDHFGFVNSFLYKINHEEAVRVASNLMGKTWFVFIENSDYEFETSLEGPSKDYKDIAEVLKGYKIDYVWHKQNLTKQQFDQFLVEELASKIKTNKVNSLIIWYPGHGFYDGYSSYWIPVDGKKAQPSSLYPIDYLKTPLQRMNLNHLLVITDACQAGAYLDER